MENATHAIHIVFGVLIAMMIIALIIFVFTTIRTVPKAQDEKQLIESMTEFNEGFLVFDKKLMYGTDVLSCLNKAQSHNQKYVNNNYFGIDSGGVTSDDRAELLVDVEITLKTAIQERVMVNYKNSLGKVVQEQSKEYNFLPFKDVSNGHTGFELPVVKYYYFAGENVVRTNTTDYADVMWGTNKNNYLNSKLKTRTYDTVLKAGRYSILSDTTGRLSALLTTVTTVEQTIYQNVSTFGNDNWCSATWRTAAYDFKTRKFKCTNYEYNKDGYVSKICFEEL